MKDIKETIVINRTAQEVFDFTLNPSNTPKWVSGVVTEQANETPPRLGTIYRNQGKDGSWREFEITDFTLGVTYTMLEKDSDVHVKYTFRRINATQCELVYDVWTDSGNLPPVFARENLQKILQRLKEVVESGTSSITDADRELLRMIADMFTSGDASGADAVFDKSYVDHQKPKFIQQDGPVEFRQIVDLARKSLTNLQVTIEGPIIADGNYLAVRLVWRSDMVERATLEMFRLAAGKIVEHWGAEGWKKQRKIDKTDKIYL